MADPASSLYFNDTENRRIFERVSRKSYLPANRIILEAINHYKETEHPFKAAYSLSGVFIDQCQRYCPAVLDSFADLVDTGMVEMLDQTYYHSLASLYDDNAEFSEQVKMHREAVWDLFGQKPEVFENTELLYDDRIARLAEGMGYSGIFAEGVVADPGQIYRPVGCDRISLLLRNYQLTDDIGFRFSSRSWEEYPLTADKYASWLAATPGRCVNIFMDYETLGEHQWAETGIFEFIRHLPEEVLKREDLRFATPSEVSTLDPAGPLSIQKTTSWADLERDTSCWLGNTLQRACHIQHARLLTLALEEGGDLLDIWRLLGLSDHLYYIYIRGGGPGEVHSYFSPYSDPYDAAVTYMSVLFDLDCRLRSSLRSADQPFRFSTGQDEFTGLEAWSLKGLLKALPDVDPASLEFHMENGDLARWAGTGLGDPVLAEHIEALAGTGGMALQKKLVRLVRSRLKDA